MTLKIRFTEYNCHYKNIAPMSNYSVLCYSAQTKFLWWWLDVSRVKFIASRIRYVKDYDSDKDTLLRRIINTRYKNSPYPIRVEEYPMIKVFQNIYF
jgi:hypothetical protein